MENFFERRSVRQWAWVIGIVLSIFLIITCNPSEAKAQRIKDVERGKTISIEKKKFSPYFYICIEGKSGARYTIKYNTHNYHSEGKSVPVLWDIIKLKNNRVNIKPVL